MSYSKNGMLAFSCLRSQDEAAAKAARLLSAELRSAADKHARVLWLVSGGSGMKVATEVSKEIIPDFDDQLAIGLIDERFGPVGHADSNWQQLQDLGFLFGDALQIPVLGADSLDAAREDYESRLAEALDKADCVVALMGIGVDGHTGGIKPMTESEFEPFLDGRLVHAFKGADFERVTVTPDVIRKLDRIVVYAVGEDKQPILEDLREKELPLHEQPAQVLRECADVDIVTTW